jgi:hypothetical protein
MISQSDGEHRAYKCYGHTHWFTDEERSAFFSMLKEIAFREDTWYTTWGEALAYQIQRDNVVMDLFSYDQNHVSFRTSVNSDSDYGVSLTYKVEIPENWRTITVIDDGRISDYSDVIKDANKTFVLLNSEPRGQIIKLSTSELLDTTEPEIHNLRTIQTDEGVAFLADVSDQHGYVSDVNITVTNGVEAYCFDKVHNPTFWTNSTYGRVVFNLPDGCYTFKVTAIDSSQNISESSRCIHIN